MSENFERVNSFLPRAEDIISEGRRIRDINRNLDEREELSLIWWMENFFNTIEAELLGARIHPDMFDPYFETTDNLREFIGPDNRDYTILHHITYFDDEVFKWETFIELVFTDQWVRVTIESSVDWYQEIRPIEFLSSNLYEIVAKLEEKIKFIREFDI